MTLRRRARTQRVAIAITGRVYEVAIEPAPDARAAEPVIDEREVRRIQRAIGVAWDRCVADLGGANGTNEARRCARRTP